MPGQWREADVKLVEKSFITLGRGHTDRIREEASYFESTAAAAILSLRTILEMARRILMMSAALMVGCKATYIP